MFKIGSIVQLIKTDLFIVPKLLSNIQILCQSDVIFYNNKYYIQILLLHPSDLVLPVDIYGNITDISNILPVDIYW